MVQLLRERAFLVETHEIGAGPVDIKSFDGLVIGSPVFGLGIKGVGPTEALARFVDSYCNDLSSIKVALFAVYKVRLGVTLDRMKGMIMGKGGTVVAALPYWFGRVENGEHMLPAECMVRIR